MKFLIALKNTTDESKNILDIGCKIAEGFSADLTICYIGKQSRTLIEGDVNLVVDVRLDAPTQPERTAMGISLTGFHCVNAVEATCEAKPNGIKTFLDLPLITGTMGSYSVFD